MGILCMNVLKKNYTNMDNEQVKKFDRAMTLILFTLLLTALTIVFTSCGTTRGGGCGGSPVHLGN